MLKYLLMESLKQFMLVFNNILVTDADGTICINSYLLLDHFNDIERTNLISPFLPYIYLIYCLAVKQQQSVLYISLPTA